MMYLIRQMTRWCTQNNKLLKLAATAAQEEKVEIERKWYVLTAYLGVLSNYEIIARVEFRVP